MKPNSRKYAEWEHAISRIKQGMTKVQVAGLLGEPSRLVSSDKIEILSYREEQTGDAVYGIRIAFTDGLVTQCYLGFELCDPKPTPPASRASRRLQLLLVVILGAALILLYGWYLARWRSASNFEL